MRAASSTACTCPRPTMRVACPVRGGPDRPLAGTALVAGRDRLRGGLGAHFGAGPVRLPGHFLGGGPLCLPARAGRGAGGGRLDLALRPGEGRPCGVARHAGARPGVPVDSGLRRPHLVADRRLAQLRGALGKDARLQSSSRGAQCWRITAARSASAARSFPAKGARRRRGMRSTTRRMSSRDACASNPDHAPGHYNLALVLQAQGR